VTDLSDRLASTTSDSVQPERVLVVSASVGAGHDGAARELEARLAQRAVVTETRDFLDALPAWIRFTVREGYTRTVTHTPWFYDWLYAAMERPGLVQRIGLLVCWLAQREVLRWCQETGADAVVSTYPLASQTLGQLVARGRLGVPTATFLTDPSVHALWVHPHIHRHLTTMPATAEVGLRDYGVPMTVAGPLVPRRFAESLAPARRDALLAELGAEPGRPIALVVTGSLGLGRVSETVDAIVATGIATPLVLCGRNERLLSELATRSDVLAFGWRHDVHELMQVCDVLVHNAGGLSFSESVVAGLPAVTYACIPGHGRDNGEVLARSGVAPLAETVQELADALRHQLRPEARRVLRTVVASAPHDAGELVLADLRDVSAVTRLQGDRRRIRARRTVQRRVGGLVAAALVALGSLGLTEGVSVAAGHGLGVASMPPGKVGLVVEPASLVASGQAVAALRAADAAVRVPAAATPADVRAARALHRAGVPLVVDACRPSTLLHHSGAQLCGAGPLLRAAGTPVSSVVVEGAEVQGLDLVVARRDATRIVLAREASDPAPLGGVWVIGPASSGSPAALRAALEHCRQQVTSAGGQLGLVTEARADR
jgi:processive 1,2-diacylglycerol beta-glucosyltransferase